MITTFKAPDIECDGCAASIRKSLERLPGVQQVDVTVATQTVTVQHDDTLVNTALLAKTLDEIGFSAQAV